jgi:transcriptional regulator with XRE-family HTH domain
MPRIKCNPTPRLLACIRQIQIYLDEHCNGNQSDLARKSGVPQYQINRILSGRTKSFTEDVNKLCSYAKINADSGIDRSVCNPRLMAALSKVNDGRSETVELLAGLIELVGKLVASNADQRPVSRKAQK